ncbi:hypothetical protein C8R44DRAFT_605950, partial [Mycena epipterygia]
FSAEFAPGGLIDESSATEHQLPWMLSTNDMNEGLLGAYRVMMHAYPRLMLHQYNVMAMFRHNDTQAFMDAVFNEDDHWYIMRAACALDASGIEAKHKKALAEFQIRLTKMKKDQEIAKAEKDAADLVALMEVKLVTCTADIYNPAWKLTVKKLKEQLTIFRVCRFQILSPSATTKTELKNGKHWRRLLGGSRQMRVVSEAKYSISKPRYCCH